MVSVDVKRHVYLLTYCVAYRAQELCESRGGLPGRPVPNSPYGLCGRKATLRRQKRSHTRVKGLAARIRFQWIMETPK